LGYNPDLQLPLTSPPHPLARLSRKKGMKKIMYNADTELLFPPRLIPQLRNLRGQGWQTLVDEVIAAGDGSLEESAFVLAMVRQAGCASCNASTFRSMNGCSNCARQTIRRHRGEDEELLEIFHETKNEFENYLNGNE
jgi:hypothetical protein